MKELKTLKDLEKAFHVGDVKEHLDENNKVGDDWMTSICLAGDLKAEAVKWVKSLDNGEDIHRADDWNKMEWIKHFFNLTEEDLK